MGVQEEKRALREQVKNIRKIKAFLYPLFST